MLWVTYITFFNSRVVGSLTTSIINKFVKIGYIKVVWKRELMIFSDLKLEFFQQLLYCVSAYLW